jgi:hypothetical protein
MLPDIRWIFVIAGVLLVIASVFGGGLEIKELKIPKIRKGARILSAVVGIVFIAIGISYKPPWPGRSPEITTPQVEITSPQEGASVPPEITVEGTLSSPIPEGYSLWLVIQDSHGDLYPEDRLPQSETETWEIPLTFGPAWLGKDAWVLIVIADASLDLKAILDRQDAEGRGRRSFPSDRDIRILARRGFEIRRSH